MLRAIRFWFICAFTLVVPVASCSKSSAKQADSMAFVAAPGGGGGSAAPKELVPIALATTQHEACEKLATTCKDYKVSTDGNVHLKLTDADRANRYEDKWCVKVTFVRQMGAWEDASFAMYISKRTGGDWVFEERAPTLYMNDMMYVGVCLAPAAGSPK